MNTPKDNWQNFIQRKLEKKQIFNQVLGNPQKLSSFNRVMEHI